jgi:hypothetical protein
METFIPKATYEALTEDEREQLREHAAKMTWFVRVSTQVAHLYVQLPGDCPAELLRMLGILPQGE